MRTNQMLKRAMEKLLVGRGDCNDKRAGCGVESARRRIRGRGTV